MSVTDQPSSRPGSSSSPGESVSRYLESSDIAVSLSDPLQDDNPLIWVNDAFEALTGYSRETCIGRNCRFLQGPMTRSTDVRAISSSLFNHRVERTEILNYRANGQPFHNAVVVGPVRAPNGAVRQFFGLQWDVTMSERRAGAEPDIGATVSSYRQRLAERQDLSKLLRDAIVKRSSLLGGQALGYAIVERLVATVRPEQFPLLGDISGLTPIGDMLEFLMQPYLGPEARQVRFSGNKELMSPDAAAALAVVFHELATPSHSMGVASPDQGDIRIQWHIEEHANQPVVMFEWSEAVNATQLVSAPETDMSGLLVADALRLMSGSIEDLSDQDHRRFRIRAPRDELVLKH